MGSVGSVPVGWVHVLFSRMVSTGLPYFYHFRIINLSIRFMIRLLKLQEDKEDFYEKVIEIFVQKDRQMDFIFKTSLGDGCSFPACLVNLDVEQAASPTGSTPVNKIAAEGRQFPSKPLRESQSRLLTSTPSWTESDIATDKDRKGSSNQAMTIEHEA